MIARDRIERVQFNSKPRGDSIAQNTTEMREAGANGRRRAADALGEVPYRQPFLEELSTIRNQKCNAAGERRRAVHLPVRPEGAAHGEFEGGGIEVGQMDEMLEEGPARKAGDGRNGTGRWLDIARLDEIQGRLDQGLTNSLASHDAFVSRARHINRESDNLHWKPTERDLHQWINSSTPRF